jgi:Flp pilus assembly protein TadD
MLKPARLGSHILRFALAALALFFCFKLTVNSAKTGYSRLLTTLTIINSTVDTADEAIRLAPGDPEAHYTRALTLVNAGRLQDAVAELRVAIKLRPHHYYEWLDLGITLDRLNDTEGARAALNEAIHLAPAFSQPRWQLGSFLFREGKYDEAFVELRLGAKNNPPLFESLLALAWVAADGDVARMDLLLQPANTHNHLALANYLTRQGQGTAAAHHIAEAGKPVEERDRALLAATMKELVASKQFKDAYLAWSATHEVASAGGGDHLAQILNGNFSEPISQNDPGFGWQLPAASNLSVSLDPSGPVPDSRSIRLEFGGDQPYGNQFLSQLVLVQAATQYSLKFAAKTEGLVTGGPPVIVVLDAGTDRVLGQSSPIPAGTSDWKDSKVDFSSAADTTATVICLRRLGCAQSPCPAFGKLWLSKFSLVRR